MTSELIPLHCRTCSGSLTNYERALCSDCERKDRNLRIVITLACIGVLGFFVWCGLVND